MTATGRHRIPSFSSSRRARLAVGTLLYLAQGFPQAVVAYSIPSWLAARGQGTAVVGTAMAAMALPWTLKFVAGFFIDRYTWLPMGRRRPWLLASQAGVLLAFLTFALLSPSPEQTALVIGIAFLISTLTAIQDVALDALVIDLTPAEEMGRLNGFMFGGKLFGIAGGVAVAGLLMQHRSIGEAMLAMSVLFAVPALAAVLVRERPGERMLPWTRGKESVQAERTSLPAWAPMLRAVGSSLRRPELLLVIGTVLVYGISQTLYEQGMMLFAVGRLGWGEGDLGSLGAISNVVIGAFSLLAGGRIVDRFGAPRVACAAGVGSLVTILILPAMPDWWGSAFFFIAWSFVTGLATTMFYLSYLVMAMRVSATEVAATSFALVAASHALGTATGGPLLAVVEAWGGFVAIFAAAGLTIFLAGLMPMFGDLFSRSEYRADRASAERV